MRVNISCTCGCLVWLLASIVSHIRSRLSLLPAEPQGHVCHNSHIAPYAGIHRPSFSSCIILIVLASMFGGYITNLLPLLPPH